MATATRVPDHISSLRDSFALHLEATRQPSTTRIYLDALDGLIRHLDANGMPTGVGAIRREHIESYLGSSARQGEARDALNRVPGAREVLALGR